MLEYIETNMNFDFRLFRFNFENICKTISSIISFFLKEIEI